nr:MAG TPA: hypothetical protein [Bacteriophage sp.]
MLFLKSKSEIKVWRFAESSPIIFQCSTSCLAIYSASSLDLLPP